MNASELTRRNISQPILQTPLFQPFLTDVAPGESPQEQGFNLLMRHRVDPSSVASKTNLYADTEKAHAGILQRPTGVAREVLQGASLGAVQPAFGLLNTLLGARRSRAVDQTGLANNDFARIHQSSKEDGAAVALTGDLHGIFNS